MSTKTSPLPEDRIPVIVGVGEIADHPTELTAGLEPLALLEAAVKRAAEDAAAPLLGEIDSLDVVNFLSWRYRDPETTRLRCFDPRRPPPVNVRKYELNLWRSFSYFRFDRASKYFS